MAGVGHAPRNENLTGPDLNLAQACPVRNVPVDIPGEGHCHRYSVRYRRVAIRRQEDNRSRMRQPTKPFVVERKPSRKPRPDAAKPSIWGRLGADISQGLKDQEDTDRRAATDGDDRT